MEIKAIVGAKFGTLSLKKTTSTNPFDTVNFRGKTFTGSALPFADVFQAIKKPKPNRLKMISASVIGAAVDFRMRLHQPIALFVSHVKQNIERGMAIVQKARLSMYNTGHSFVEMNKNLYERISGVFYKPKTILPEKESGIKILSLKHINEHASVKDLRATWLHLNETLAKEGKTAA